MAVSWLINEGDPNYLLTKKILQVGNWKRHSMTLHVGVFFSGRKSNIPLGMAPSQDASDHQDCYMFSRKSPTKPSFATVTGRGPHPKHTLIFQFPKNKYLKDFGRKGPVYIGLPGSLGNNFFKGN